MNNNEQKQIITALATPYGKSAVAVIRISGDGSILLVNKFLKRPLEIGEIKYNTFVYNGFGEHLMAVGFEAPRSFTGEESAELYPHGNMTVCEEIINALITGGARLAERGEFTKRAFLNGKLDLMQCEALADIIDAQTSEQLRYGNDRYDREYKALYEVENDLKTSLGEVEAVLHYGDELEGEDVDEQNLLKNVRNTVDKCIKALEKEKIGFDGGKTINDGFKVALIGKPNVGKSTVLNALTESDRAIVTPIAGTTRDTVTGEYVYDGRKFVITDTAGINDNTDDEVEKIGIKRAVAAAKDADAVVFVTDSIDDDIASTIEKPSRYAVVCNKCDKTADVGKDYGKAEKCDTIQISAKFGINIVALKQKIFDLCPKDHGSICNHRQFGCVLKCLDSLYTAREESKKADGLEIVAALLYEAYSAILELYGEQADEKIITDVFQRFCVGK